MRGRPGRRIFRWKIDGWACRRVLSIPAPIAVLRGGQPPGRGCSITRTRTHHHPRTGGCTPDPRTRLPWICEEGPGGALVDEKLWMDMPPRFAHPYPYHLRQGTGGRQPPGKGRTRFPVRSRDTRLCPGVAPDWGGLPMTCREGEARASFNGKMPDGHAGAVCPPSPRNIPIMCGDGRAQGRGAMSGAFFSDAGGDDLPAGDCERQETKKDAGRASGSALRIFTLGG